MRMITEKEFNKPEKLSIIEACLVAGKPVKVGDTVTVSGNDKIQLLASHRAERAGDDSKDKGSKK